MTRRDSLAPWCIDCADVVALIRAFVAARVQSQRIDCDDRFPRIFLRIPPPVFESAHALSRVASVSLSDEFFTTAPPPLAPLARREIDEAALSRATSAPSLHCVSKLHQSFPQIRHTAQLRAPCPKGEKKQYRSPREIIFLRQRGALRDASRQCVRERRGLWGE